MGLTFNTPKRILRFAATVAIALTLALLMSTATAGTLTTTIDQPVIQLGQSTTLNLIFQDASPNSVPNLPTIPGLNARFVGQATHFSIQNNRTAASVQFRYEVAPSRTGDILIPPVIVVVDGKTLQSQPITLKVLARGEAPALTPEEKKQAFVRLILQKQEFYVGEVIPFEVQLYFQSAQNLQMPQLLSDGFTMGKQSQPMQSRTAIDNMPYNVITFRMTATAYKTGELTFGPAECALSIAVPSTRPDPFDVFGNRMEMKRVALASESFKVRVLSVPTTNAPPSFTGSVGSFKMGFAAQPSELNVGDPIVLKVDISGRGNFDALKIPSLEGWRDFKVYPPTSSIGLTDPLGMEGRKSFEIVVVPQNAELKEVPEFAFSYFDPDQKTFRTEKHPATPLKIRASGQTQAQPTVIAATNAAPIQPIASDIVHIKPVLGSLQSPAPPLLASRWFIALQGVPLAAALGFWGWRRVQIRRASDPRRLRREASQRWLNEQLPQLDRLATTGNAPEFFVLAVRALQEQLGSQFDLPSGSITESIIDTRVAPAGAAPELQEQLHRLFQTFNAARYAPTSSVQELSALSKQVRQVIADLQQLGGNVR